MLSIIEDHARRHDRQLVDTMFADRKRLFVDLLGWTVPVIDGRLEMDQFDREDTVYLALTASDGSHDASMRLMPTTRPHMLGSLFGELCPHGVPVGNTIWESSRLCLPARHGAAKRRELRHLLITAMVDFALERGITCYTGILPRKFRKEVLAMGWLAEPLGPAVTMAGGCIGAFAAHIGLDTPARLRWTGTYIDHASKINAGPEMRG